MQLYHWALAVHARMTRVLAYNSGQVPPSYRVDRQSLITEACVIVSRAFANLREEGQDGSGQEPKNLPVTGKPTCERSRRFVLCPTNPLCVCGLFELSPRDPDFNPYSERRICLLSFVALECTHPGNLEALAYATLCSLGAFALCWSHRYA